MESRLDPQRFFRIHRSRIVNTERIKELQPWFNGEYVVVLHNGTQLRLSRSYREKLEERLGKALNGARCSAPARCWCRARRPEPRILKLLSHTLNWSRSCTASRYARPTR